MLLIQSAGTRHILALILLASSAPVAAQTVRGRVADQKSHKPIVAATVALVDRRQGVVARTETPEDGQYLLQAPVPGTYRLWFRLPGYRPAVKDLSELTVGGIVEYSPELERLPPLVLAVVVVNGEQVPAYLEGFYSRKATGRGNFLTRADIETWRPSEPSRLIALLPGFYTRDGGNGRPIITSRRQSPAPPKGLRSCPPLVFVDGVQVGNTETWDIDSFLMVSDIEAIEAYSGPASMPVEFNATGAKCGAIIIWRRAG